MKETQLLLKGPLVISTQELLKTQTRRLDGLEYVNENPDLWPVIRRTQLEEPTTDGGIQTFPGVRPDSWLALKNPAGVGGMGFLCLRCPYGDVGDLLWVRETFSGPYGCRNLPPRDWPVTCPLWYWADGNPSSGDWTKPYPSIHMPRWACRLVLEIVSIRVERLQDISDDDAEAEGIECKSMPTGGDDYVNYWRDYSLTEKQADGWPYFNDGKQRDSFFTLWQSVYGAGSVAANPWVWVIGFKVVPQ